MSVEMDKDIILSRLEKVKGNGTKYRTKCPVRDHSSGDNTLSLLFPDDGRVLIHCHAGCEALEVIQSIGLSMTDLFPNGAVRHFMASAAERPKKQGRSNHYKLLNEAWLRNFEAERKELKKGERFTEETLKSARDHYRKSKR